MNRNAYEYYERRFVRFHSAAEILLKLNNGRRFKDWGYNNKYTFKHDVAERRKAWDEMAKLGF